MTDYYTPWHSLRFIDFMHNGTPSRHSRSVRQCLNEEFGLPWIEYTPAVHVWSHCLWDLMKKLFIIQTNRLHPLNNYGIRLNVAFTIRNTRSRSDLEQDKIKLDWTKIKMRGWVWLNWLKVKKEKKTREKGRYEIYIYIYNSGSGGSMCYDNELWNLDRS